MVILLVERIFATSEARNACGIFSSSTAKDDRVFMMFPGQANHSWEKPVACAGCPFKTTVLLLAL